MPKISKLYERLAAYESVRADLGGTGRIMTEKNGEGRRMAADRLAESALQSGIL